MLQAFIDFVNAGDQPIPQIFWGAAGFMAFLFAIEFLNWLWNERPK